MPHRYLLFAWLVREQPLAEEFLPASVLNFISSEARAMLVATPLSVCQILFA